MGLLREKGEQTEKAEKKPLLPSIREVGLPKLLLMLAAGLVIIVLSIPDAMPRKAPSGAASTEPQEEGAETGDGEEEAYVKELEGKLSGVLAQVKGVGRVNVMITIASSKEKVTLKDAPYTSEELQEKDDAGGSREQKKVSREEQSVLVDGADGSVPYVLKENEPAVEGIVVVAEGGDDVQVQNEIIGAVEVLFNVPKHKIKVMKMNFVKG